MEQLKKMAILLTVKERLDEDIEKLKGHINYLEINNAGDEPETFEIILGSRWTAPVKVTLESPHAELGLVIFKATLMLMEQRVEQLNIQLLKAEELLVPVGPLTKRLSQANIDKLIEEGQEEE